MKPVCCAPRIRNGQHICPTNLAGAQRLTLQNNVISALHLLQEFSLKITRNRRHGKVRRACRFRPEGPGSARGTCSDLLQTRSDSACNKLHALKTGGILTILFYHFGSRCPETMAIVFTTPAVASAQRAASRKVAVRQCCKALAKSKAARAYLRDSS